MLTLDRIHDRGCNGPTYRDQCHTWGRPRTARGGSAASRSGPMGVWQPYDGIYEKSATYIIFVLVSTYYMQMDIVVGLIMNTG